MLKPCMVCGEPSAGTRCSDHDRETERLRHLHHNRGTRLARGYDAAWIKLSRRARRIQPWCTRCGTTDNLTGDHTPQAWARKAAGLPIPLEDVDVLCAGCNASAGSSRPGTRRAFSPGEGTPIPSQRPAALKHGNRHTPERPRGIG